MTTQNKTLLGLALVMVAGVGSFFYLHRRDVNALAGFLEAYEKYDQAVVDLSIPVLISNPGDSAADKKLSAICKQIESAGPNNGKLDMAKEALMLNNLLWDRLKKTDTMEARASRALAGLERQVFPLSKISSMIKNEKVIPEIGNEITGYSRDELVNLRLCKKIIVNKREMTNQLLQGLVEEGSGLNGYISLLKQRNFQLYPQDQDDEFGRLAKRFDELNKNRKVAFNRFMELGK